MEARSAALKGAEVCDEDPREKKPNYQINITDQASGGAGCAFAMTQIQQERRARQGQLVRAIRKVAQSDALCKKSELSFKEGCFPVTRPNTP